MLFYIFSHLSLWLFVHGKYYYFAYYFARRFSQFACAHARSLKGTFKSSPLDYIPTSLLKSCADTFSILISHLANLSFTQATFPSKFKLALISPLLKKPGLPKSDLANFRPISNLNTIGKILERLALSRIFPHI